MENGQVQNEDGLHPQGAVFRRGSHTVAVTAIVRNTREEVLCVFHRKRQAWELPGGTVEDHESLVDAIQRELVEEVGLSVRVDSVSGVYKLLDLTTIVIAFRAFADGEPAVGDDVEAALWLPIDEALIRVSGRNKVRIKDSLNSGAAVGFALDSEQTQ